MKKRLLAVLLCVIMVMPLLPTTVFAVEGETFTVWSTDETPVAVTVMVLTEPSGSTPGTVQVGNGADRAVDRYLTHLSLPGVITKPGTTDQYTVTVIGKGALYYCPSLVSASFPNATRVENFAFNACSSLANVYLPEATSIGDYAFDGCASLTNVSLPKVETINIMAFHGCTSLTGVSLPKVTSIANSAFWECTSLAGITIWQNNAPTLGSYAFEKIPSTCKLYVPSGASGYTQANGWLSSANIVYLSAVSGKVKDIEGNLVDGATVSVDGTSTLSDANGAYSVYVKSGDCTITAEKSGSGNGHVVVTNVTSDRENANIVFDSVASVTLSPATASVVKGGNTHFTATASGTGNPAQAVTWSVDGGVTDTFIDTNGNLIVAAGETASTLTVRATSTFDTSKSGTALVTITQPPATPVIHFGTDNLTVNSRIYFGSYTDGSTTYNVPWIVLPSGTMSETNNATSNTLPLLSEYLLGEADIQAGTVGYYAGGVMNSRMSSICSSFNSKEQSAIVNTTLSGNSMLSGKSDLTGQKLFPLSFVEAGNFSDGSPILKSAQISDPDGDTAFWWLRTFSSNKQEYGVDSNGTLTELQMYLDRGVRPAFHLDLSTVLFCSAANGSKIDASVDSALTQVSAVVPKDWKLTLLDSSRNGFTASLNGTKGTASNPVVAGQNIAVNFSGAQTGTHEYVSAILTDSSNNVLYYGRIANNIANATAQEIAIPAGLATGTYTLRFFNEQFNGDYKTDYASAFKDVTLTVINPVEFEALAARNGSDDASTTALTLLFDKDVAGLSAEDITLTGATKGTLTKESAIGTYVLTISDITVADKSTVNVTVSKNGFSFTPANMSVTVRKYTPPYAITYNANGGTGTMTNGTATHGTSFILPNCGFTAPTGKHFVAWAIGKTSGTHIVPGGTYEITAATTVYAMWQTNSYTVSYNGNKPSGASGSVSNVPTGDDYDYDDDFNLGAAPTLAGYTFGGWYKDAACTEAKRVGNADANVSNLSAVNGDTVTLYAKWTADIYTVTYNANGGSGTMENGTATHVTAFTLPSCGFTAPAGKRFKEWAIGSATGTKVAAGGTHNFTTSTTVYAVWESIPIDPDPIKHEIIKGQDGEWTEGGTGGLGFTADGDYETFTGVWVDGTALSSDKYTSQSGSTIVTLKAAYLKTLSVGQHTLRINFMDGYAKTHFTIKAATDPDNPITGDSSQPLLWVSIALLACAGLAASLVLSRKKRQNG